MTHGPGRYDDFATYVRERTEAGGVIVMVFGGKSGDGFSVQADLETTFALPAILRDLANQIERDLKRGPGEPIK
jgi:hypothetical protein